MSDSYEALARLEKIIGYKNNELADLKDDMQAQQAKLSAQAEELAALRKFAHHALRHTALNKTPISMESFQHFKIIDENGNATKLLTGEKE